MQLFDPAPLRPLPLVLSLFTAACSPGSGLPSGPGPGADATDGGVAIDLARGGVADLGDTSALFTGVWIWDGASSSSSTVCDNGGHSNDGPPSGTIAITSGPGARQVNIGAGTTACPVFLFDVAGGVATLAGPGTTCNSGPGTLTPRSGSLTSSGDDATMTVLLVLDAEEPSNTGLVHCVITVSGTASRRR